MKKIFLVSALFLSTNLMAGNYSNYQELEQIQFYEGHSGLLIKQETMVDPDNCGRQDYYILPQNRAMFKEVYSALLSALHAKRESNFGLMVAMKVFQRLSTSI